MSHQLKPNRMFEDTKAKIKTFHCKTVVIWHVNDCIVIINDFQGILTKWGICTLKLISVSDSSTHKCFDLSVVLLGGVFENNICTKVYYIWNYRGIRPGVNGLYTPKRDLFQTHKSIGDFSIQYNITICTKHSLGATGSHYTTANVI